MKRKAKAKWTPLKIYEGAQNWSGHSWYWKLCARNGNVVCDGGEPYLTKAKARAGFRSAAKLAAIALKQLEDEK